MDKKSITNRNNVAMPPKNQLISHTTVKSGPTPAQMNCIVVKYGATPAKPIVPR
jgi:hypothetical protein